MVDVYSINENINEYRELLHNSSFGKGDIDLNKRGHRILHFIPNNKIF